MIEVVAVGCTTSFPFKAFEPNHPFDAVHDVAFVEVHVSVDVAFPRLLSCSVVGFATNVMVGTGGITVRVTLCTTEPPGPEQVSTYVIDVVAVGWTISLPLSAFEPLQPFDAVHEVAFVDVHASVEVAFPALPSFKVVGFAVSVRVGAGIWTGLTVTVTDFEIVPPAPVQSSV